MDHQPKRAGTKTIGVWAVSLNHRRRIFRPHGARFRSRLPTLGVMLAAAGGVTTLAVVASLFIRSSDAPARAPGGLQLSASADRLAVVDGDTLLVGDRVVRLDGIAAPTRGSTCHAASQADMDCGAAAAEALASLVRGSPVNCTIRGHDGQGRPVGNCRAGGTWLNEALVLDGWARAETADLRQPEATARAARRGIWRMGS
jgi:endonuclease YncB( thermonuclease family)